MNLSNNREMAMHRKVLIIVQNESVPFDLRVWQEALALHEHGYQVTVLCPKRKYAMKSHEILSGIHIYRHPAAGEGKHAIGYLIEFAWSLMWEALLAWWIYFKRGFHVIQGCNPPDDIFLVALPFKLLGVKYIFDHHDASPELYMAKFGKKDFLYLCQVALERMTYRFSDVVIATNDSYKEIALVRGRRMTDDVFVVRNGPNPKAFQAVLSADALKHGKRYLVGYVGTMNAQDGLDLLLDVAWRVKAAGRRDIHFTCVGTGPALPILRAMVREKDLTELVDFTGRVSDELLLKILSTADVCVNPDKPCEMNNISTMIKIMEYMALGKPIVQFESKEGRVSAQSASLYAGGEDPVGDFAEKLLYLLDHPDEREKMGQVGRKRVEEELAWTYSVRRLCAAYERAFSKRRSGLKNFIAGPFLDTNWFYSLKPVIPRSLQIVVRRHIVRQTARRSRDFWPIWEASAAPPPRWPGWPYGKRFALVLTHDVESETGVARCEELAKLEEQRGFRSTFAFVPLRYQTPEALRHRLSERGFEVMVHDLHHDGKLYRTRSIFEQRKVGINYFLRRWGVSGFCSGSMHHNLRWIGQLEIDYDISTFDVDPFEPQACGLGRIFPCWVESPNRERRGFVELPYTLPQDFSLFVLLRERTNVLWRQKLDWIAEKGGMALIKTHPDYMEFGAGDRQMDRYPVELYTEFLDYIQSGYGGQFWLAHPSEVARYWRGLRLPFIGSANTIPASSTFCASCRQAHAEGWLNYYPQATPTLSLAAHAR
jgi:glycosyltransferase involved in cell wall biosynthesis